MPNLYVIPTPIGNLDDISNNFKTYIEKADVIFCEDTRVTGKLLSLLKIEKKKLISNNNFNENIIVDKVKQVFNEYENIALVSDAGAPTISDPGYRIIELAVEMGVNVLPISGPSSIINFLMGCGLSYDTFSFVGFIPKKAKYIIDLIENRRNRELTIFFESPSRIIKTLEEIGKNYPDLELVVAKELTKLNERFYRGTASKIIETINAKGEFIVGFIKKNNKIIYEGHKIKSEVDILTKDGMTKKEAIKKVSEKLKINKNEVYKKYHEQ